MELIKQKALPEGIYHAWMYKIDLSLEDDENQVPALIYWYGTSYEFSVVALRDVLPFEQGKALGYDTVPDFMARRLDLDMSVPAVYQLVREGMEQLQNPAAKLPPSKRSAIIVHPKRKRQVVLNEWHALSMDPPPQQQLWLEKRDRLMGKLPNAEYFGTIGFLPFTKGGNKQQHQHFHPILILSPFRVPPGPIRKEWFHKCCSKQMVLVYWFGAYICGRPQSAYSFSYLSQVISLEAGIELGYDQLPPYALQEYYGSSNSRPSRSSNDSSKRTVSQKLSWMADWVVCGHWELQQALTKEKENRWGGLEDFEEDFADDFEYYWECIEAAEIAIQAKQQLQNERKQIDNNNTATKPDEPTMDAPTNQQHAVKTPQLGVEPSAKRKSSAKVNGQSSDDGGNKPTALSAEDKDAKVNGQNSDDGGNKTTALSAQDKDTDKKVRSKRSDERNSSESNGEHLTLDSSEFIGGSPIAVGGIQSEARSREGKKIVSRSKKRRRTIDVEEDEGATVARLTEGDEDSESKATGGNTKQHGRNDHRRDDKMHPSTSRFAKTTVKKLKKRRRSQSTSDERYSESMKSPDRNANGKKVANGVLDQSVTKKLKKRRRSIDLDDDDDEMMLAPASEADVRDTQAASRSDDKIDAMNVVASFRIPRKRDKRTKADKETDETHTPAAQAVQNRIPQLTTAEEAKNKTKLGDLRTEKSNYDLNIVHGAGKAEGKKSKLKRSKSASKSTLGDRTVSELDKAGSTPDGEGKEQRDASVREADSTQDEASDANVGDIKGQRKAALGTDVETGERKSKGLAGSGSLDGATKKLKKAKRLEKSRKKSALKGKQNIKSTESAQISKDASDSEPESKNVKRSLQAKSRKSKDGKLKVASEDGEPAQIEVKKASAKRGGTAKALRPTDTRLPPKEDSRHSKVQDAGKAENEPPDSVGKFSSAMIGAEGAEAPLGKKEKGSSSQSHTSQDISIIQILNKPFAESTRPRSPTSPFVVSSDQSRYSRFESEKLELDASVDDVSRKAVPRDSPSNKADVSLIQHMTDAKFSLVNGNGAIKESLDEGKDSREADTSLDEAVQKSLLSCAAALKGEGAQPAAKNQPKKSKRKNGKQIATAAKSVAAATPMSPDRLAELRRHEETQAVVARVIEEWTRNKERMMKSK